MEFLLGLILVILLIRWLMIRSQLQRIERQLRTADDQIQVLTRRLWAIEHREAAATPTASEALPLPVSLAEPASSPPVAPIPAATVVAEPRPTLRDRLRAWVGDEGFEALVGGNLLNKLGALAFVVGIALFLGYSLTQMGPVGRVATGLALSFGLLGAGIAIERKAAYRVFARGLIGAGWAGLYFTVYAMGAVSSARIIQNPWLATVLLIAVACAMVAHSLRYDSQSATAVAYFSAFAALAQSESTPLAAGALVPLAASLLFIAYRKQWHAMALFGLAATYGTLMSRGDSGSPLAVAQTIFFVFWALFEGLDILRVRAGATQTWVTAAVFPLNSLMFLALSYAKWENSSPKDHWHLAAGTSVLFAASALLRRSAFAAPLTISAALAALAIAGGTKGAWIAAGLAMESAFLFELGVRQQRKIFRVEGYIGAFFALWALAAASDGVFHKFAQRSVWLPVATAALAAGAFAARLHRAEFAERDAVRAISAGVGIILAALVCWTLLPDVLVAVAWMALALVLASLETPAYRIQGQVLAMVSFGRLFLANFTNEGATFGISHRLLTVPPIVACLYSLRRRVFLWAAAVAIVVLLRFELGRAYAITGWSLVTIAFLWLAVRLANADFRLQSYAVALLVAARGISTQFNAPQSFSGLSGRMAIAATAITSLYACEWIAPRPLEKARIYFSLLASLLLGFLLYQEVSGSLVTVAWGLEGLLLLAAGFPLKERVLRLSGLGLLLLCILKLFVYDLRNLETFYRILSFLALGLILMGVSWVYARVRRYL